MSDPTTDPEFDPAPGRQDPPSQPSSRHNGHADFLRERIDGATGD